MVLRKGLADASRHALRAVGFRAVTRTVRGAPLRIPLAMGELKVAAVRSDLLAVLQRRRSDGRVGCAGCGRRCGVRHRGVSRRVGGASGATCARGRRLRAESRNLSGAAKKRSPSIAHAMSPPALSRLAVTSGIADFWGTGSGASLRPGHYRPSCTSVKVETLDRFVERRASLPDVLKIDVEGAEHQVLAGARRASRMRGSCASKCTSTSCRSSAQTTRW